MWQSRSKIADRYTEKQMRRPVAILLLGRAVDRSSDDNNELLVQLDRVYLSRRDVYSRVFSWSEMLKRNPSSAPIWNQLVRSFRAGAFISGPFGNLNGHEI